MRDQIFGVAIVGLVALIAVLCVLVIQTWSGTTAIAETGMNAPNMVAVTGRVGSDYSVCYVIDTDKKQLAVYSAFGGRRIRFVGARRIKYDFELVAYNDATSARYSVPNMKKAWREAQNKKEDKGKGGKRR
ncbi:MAG: hypothetical protein ACYTHN_19310 [Planctomycetota bacterium]|jgi:hypothetical protein